MNNDMAHCVFHRLPPFMRKQAKPGVAARIIQESFVAFACVVHQVPTLTTRL